MPNMLPSIEESLTDLDNVLEALDDSPIGEAIPFVDRAIKIWRAVGKFRDAMLARKLLSFITDPSLQTDDARTRMRERAGSAEGRKVGEILFLVLERLNDFQKPAWLAKAYAAYLANEISASDFRRIASAIDIAFSDDLVALISSNDEISHDYTSWMRALVTSGFVELRVPAPLGGKPGVYGLSKWGTMLRRAVRAYAGPHSANETGLV